MPEKETAFEAVLRIIDRMATCICLVAIQFYRKFISPIKPQVCRFYPTCSQYTYDAFLKYGFVKGLALGVKRVLRCHPFNPGGYHPVE